MTPVLWRTQYWPQNVNKYGCFLKIHKIGFRSKKKTYKKALSAPYN